MQTIPYLCSNKTIELMEYYEVYDELTNKSLLIKAPCLEQAINVSEKIDFNDYENGDIVE